MAQANQTALILGASRGLGLALAEEYLKRGWRVIATERNASKSQLSELKSRYASTLEIKTVDINHDAQVQALSADLAGRSLDLLLVNAGIALGAEDILEKVPAADFINVMRTNAVSPMKSIAALQSLVTPTGTIAAMSSTLGSVGANDSGAWEVYRASKAALNTLMRSYVARDAISKRSFLLLCPGWVRTDMGGPGASLSIEESIPKLVSVITSHEGQPGLRYRNYKGETVPW